MSTDYANHLISREDASIRSESIPGDLIAVLEHHVRQTPDKLAFTFLMDGENHNQLLSYAQLHTQAKRIAIQLRKMAKCGERALLLYPPGLEYIAAFMGCLYASVVAVPVYPPSKHSLHRLKAIIEDATPTLVLTTQDLAEKLQRDSVPLETYRDLQWLATDVMLDGDSTSWVPPVINAHSLAFLQYTSGSTGNPKGVMVSHRNLMANQRIICKAFGHDRDTVVVGWLPLYHDMGLIGNVLQPLFLGASAILMSPLAFLEKPVRWLKAITRYRATTSGGPNFAYDLCLQKITTEQKLDLDLSSWAIAFNGSEPIRDVTLRRFVDAFTQCGFRRDAFFPCYGLAENTLFATGGKRVVEPAGEMDDVHSCHLHSDSSRWVSCGRVWDDHAVCIVDPETSQPCVDGTEGEIWITGSSVTLGYWNRAETSKAVFSARLHDRGDTDAIGCSEARYRQAEFLRTGDVGFVYQDELFVTGRIKDLIILRGRNYYPQDIEQAIDEGVQGIRFHSCAAFSLESAGKEYLVVATEVRRKKIGTAEAERIFMQMRQVLSEACEVPIGELVLVPPGAIMKTSSGKIQHQAIKQAYQTGQLTILAHSGSSNSVLARSSSAAVVADLTEYDGIDWRQLDRDQCVLHVQNVLLVKLATILAIPDSSVPVDVAVRTLGMDSLRMVEFKHAIDADLGTDVSLGLLFSDRSIVDLAQMLTEEKQGRDAGLTVAASAPVYEASQLSLAEQAIWTVHQLETENIAYNLHLALRIKGQCDPRMLQNGLDILLQRHVQLRTAYRLEGDSVRKQVIGQNELTDYFSIVDARNWSESALQVDFANRIRKPFDLETAPLLTVTCYQLGKDCQILLFCMHHIVIDLSASLVLLAELQSILDDLTFLQLKKVQPVCDYQAFVGWQQAYLASPRCIVDRDYWLQQLSGALPILTLPTDYPHPLVSQYRGASHTVRIDRETTEAIRQLCRKQGASLFALLLTVYKVLLYRYTHELDLIVGTASNGRSRFKSVVGNVVNPIALRSRPYGRLSFSVYLQQVRDTVIDALSHADYPFSLLVEHIQPERSQDTWPIYQTWFGLQQGQFATGEDCSHWVLGEDTGGVNWGEWVVTPKAINQPIENFDLRLMAAEDQEGLLLSFKYRRDLFSADTIISLAGHYENLLTDVLVRPDCRLDELQVLTPTEKLHQLVEWNASTVYDAEQGCLHELFAAQVQRTPEKIALACDGKSLTYAELEAQTNQLAQYLRKRGVQPESMVALCVRRSVDMLIGILGILKAGGAYVPIDPDFPQERIASIVLDSRSMLVVTQQALKDRISVHQHHVVYLDADYKSILQEPVTAPAQWAVPANLAYVIYTSGSTGKPKGVAVTHANVVRSTQARFHAYSHPVEGFLLLSSFIFDSSVAGIFWTLSQGGRLVLPAEGSEMNPRKLGQLLSGNRITHFLCLPSLYRVLLDSVARADLVYLKTVIVAGEACPANLIQKHDTVLPQVSFFNEYGPTEGTVWSSVYPLQQHTVPHQPVAIGKPVANVQIYLLDPTMQPVPVGVAGELYIGGAGLARGYLYRPELTAERFIPNPFVMIRDADQERKELASQYDDSRLYRTGDLGRYRTDGNIEFLGRQDDQVKIRGFRIEPGEIESRLRQYPGIAEALVLVQGGTGESRRLVAYVVADSASTTGPGVADAFDSHRLQAFLRAYLPDYMVPANHVLVDAIPRLPNGKVDRAALQVLQDHAPCIRSDRVAPRNAVEQTILAIWQEVLQIKDTFGIHDNFFDLGGHSIAAIRVMVRIQEEFAIELAATHLFEASTVARLAELVNQQIVAQNDDVLELLLNEVEFLADKQEETVSGGVA